MPKITVYQPVEAIEIDTDFPMYRKWKGFCYYKVLDEEKSIQVMDAGFSSQIQVTNYRIPPNSVNIDSEEITPQEFYEAYARVRHAIDEACGIEINHLTETLY